MTKQRDLIAWSYLPREWIQQSIFRRNILTDSLLKLHNYWRSIFFFSSKTYNLCWVLRLSNICIYTLNVIYINIYIVCVCIYTWKTICHTRRGRCKCRGKEITAFMFTHTCLDSMVKQKHPGECVIK